MKSGTKLVLGMVVVASCLAAWARLRAREQAPINLEAGASAHVRITKKADLRVAGVLSQGAKMDVELQAGGSILMLAKDWEGKEIDVNVPDGGAVLKVTNRTALPVQGKIVWKKRAP